MTYEYQAWPCWCHGPNGESAIFDSEEDVPKGWTHHEEPKPEKDLSDPHNVPSASEEATTEAAEPVAAEGKEELAGLRAHYKKVTGKKAFMGWSADQLREKLDAAEK